MEENNKSDKLTAFEEQKANEIENKESSRLLRAMISSALSLAKMKGKLVLNIDEK